MVVSTPPVVAIETSNPVTGRTVGNDTIRALPLATQNFHQLLTLSAGAISNLNASAQLGRGDVGIDVNGQRDDNNNYLLDGVSVTDLRNSQLLNTPLPSPEAVQTQRAVRLMATPFRTPLRQAWRLDLRGRAL